MELMKIYSMLYLFFQISSFNVAIVDGTPAVGQSAAAADGTSNDTQNRKELAALLIDFDKFATDLERKSKPKPDQQQLAEGSLTNLLVSFYNQMKQFATLTGMEMPKAIEGITIGRIQKYALKQFLADRNKEKFGSDTRNEEKFRANIGRFLGPMLGSEMAITAVNKSAELITQLEKLKEALQKMEVNIAGKNRKVAQIATILGKLTKVELNLKPEKRDQLREEAEALGMEEHILDYMFGGYKKIGRLLTKITIRISKIKLRYGRSPNVLEESKKSLNEQMSYLKFETVKNIILDGTKCGEMLEKCNKTLLGEDATGHCQDELQFAFSKLNAKTKEIGILDWINKQMAQTLAKGNEQEIMKLQQKLLGKESASAKDPVLAKVQKVLLIKIGHLFHLYYEMKLPMAQKRQQELAQNGIALGKQTTQKEAPTYIEGKNLTDKVVAY